MGDLNTALEAWTVFHDSIGVDLKALLLPAASQAEINAAEISLGYELPSELKMLYQIANGQIDPWKQANPNPDGGAVTRTAAMFGHFRFLTLQEALAEHQERLALHEEEDTFEPWGLRAEDPIAPVDWIPSWFGFAAAEAGNGYAVDVAPTEGGVVGQIIQLGPDFERQRVARSLSELMSQAASRIPLNQEGRFAVDTRDTANGCDFVEFNMDWNWEPPIPPSVEEIAAAALAYRDH